MTPTRILAVALLASVSALTACAKKADPAAPASEPVAETAAAPVEPAAPSVDYAAVAAAAVADPARPEEDRKDDERRKPATALEFMQVAPGSVIFEIEAGSGWYTDLLSHATGPSGAVIMQNPQGFLSFVGEQITTRLADNRLGNVRQAISNFDALDAADGSVDIVTWVRGPHELYYKPEDGASLGDPDKSYSEIYRILKPGGSFTVIDHAAAAGAPESSGNDLHRIDRAIVVSMAGAVGFKVEAESNFLANPEDPLTIAVFDPAIRGHTDQFAIRFRKPL
jgi:predicted methyltransferase